MKIFMILQNKQYNMYQFNSNHFFQITERLKIRSSGNAACGSQDETNWSDIMQTSRFCRIYGLHEVAIWCYNQTIELIDFLPIRIENKNKKALKSLNEVKEQISFENPFHNQLSQLYNRISSEN